MVKYPRKSRESESIFLTQVKALANILFFFFFFFREMPRFIYCRLNDIFSLIMTFRMKYEFLYQINKNVSTFKYYLVGGVKHIGILWQYQSSFFFLLFVGHPNVIYAAPSLLLKVFSFFCGSCHILIHVFLLTRFFLDMVYLLNSLIILFFF